MGATITISLLPPSNDSQQERTAEQLLDDVYKLLNIYNQRFSANDANSELMQVNLAAGKHPVPVDPELFELIQIGKEQSLLPASHLNIALGPLVQTWRIGFSDARIPNNDEVAHALSLTDPQLIELDPLSCTVFLAKEGMKPISNPSVVTSGTYERKLLVNEHTYHHILDRTTGYPVDTQLASITIISDNSLDGEIWTTRLYGEKPRQLLARVEQEKDIEALIVTTDNRVYYSSGISPEFLA